MVTRQGKDLLRNTIRSTDYHNRLLEEDDMWRQWDLERGLTMMVTDDYLKKKLRMDQYSRPLKSSLCEPNRDNYWTKKLFQAEEKDPDRWGHSGYKELYPEEFGKRKPRSPSSSPASSDRRKISHKNKNHSKHSRSKRKRHDRGESEEEEDDKQRVTTPHRKHKKIKDKKRIRNSSKKRNNKEMSSNSSDYSTTPNPPSSDEEGESEKKSVKSDKCDDSSTSSSESDNEKLREEQLQRLARFRRHFRSCSVEKETQDDRDVQVDNRKDSVSWSERIRCECDGNEYNRRRKRERKTSKIKKCRRRHKNVE